MIGTGAAVRVRGPNIRTGSIVVGNFGSRKTKAGGSLVEAATNANASAGAPTRFRKKAKGLRPMADMAPTVEAAAEASARAVGDASAPPVQTGGATPGSYATTRAPSEPLLEWARGCRCWGVCRGRGRRQ